MLKMRLFTAPDAVNNKAMSKLINVSYAKQSTPYGVEIVEMIAQKLGVTTVGNILH
jgi:hypothetical protein